MATAADDEETIKSGASDDAFAEATESLDQGVVVPMPTFPDASIRILSDNTKLAFVVENARYPAGLLAEVNAPAIVPKVDAVGEADL